VEFDEGYFSVILGESSTLDSDTFADDTGLWLEVAPNGQGALPRIQLTSVPSAISAETAYSVSGGVVDASEVRINGTTVISSDGSLQASASFNDLTDVPAGLDDGDDDSFAALLSCNEDNILQHDGAQWQCVDSSTLIIDASQLSGTVDISNLPVGDSENELMVGNAPDADTLADLDCADGEAAVYAGGSGTWECAAVAGGGGGLTLRFEFDEPNGTDFADSSGNGIVMSAIAGGQSAGSQGHSGNAVNFSGGGLMVAQGNAIPDGPYVTVESWVLPAVNLAGSQAIVEKSGAYSLKQQDGLVSFAVTAAKGDCTVSYPDPVVLGEWTYVSGYYNGREVVVTVGGDSAVSSCDKGPVEPSVGSAFFVGVENQSRSSPYFGFIDELRVWSTAPTDSRADYYGLFEDSDILTQAEMLQINRWGGMVGQKWERCYSMKDDGTSRQTWRNQCKTRGQNVMVAEMSNGKRIGAYTPHSWSQHNSQYRGYSGKSFLFSLTEMERLNIGTYYEYEIYNHTSYGPTYGNGHDIYFRGTMDQMSCRHPYAYGRAYPNSEWSNTNAGSQWLCGGNDYEVLTVANVEMFVISND
jgi:hypothetical protein